MFLECNHFEDTGTEAETLYRGIRVKDNVWSRTVVQPAGTGQYGIKAMEHLRWDTANG